MYPIHWLSLARANTVLHRDMKLILISFITTHSYINITHSKLNISYVVSKLRFRLSQIPYAKLYHALYYMNAPKLTHQSRTKSCIDIDSIQFPSWKLSCVFLQYQQNEMPEGKRVPAQTFMMMESSQDYISWFCEPLRARYYNNANPIPLTRNKKIRSLASLLKILEVEQAS